MARGCAASAVLLLLCLCLRPAHGLEGLATLLQPITPNQLERIFQTQTRVVSRSGSDADAFLTQLRETEPLAQHMASLLDFENIYVQAAGFPNAIRTTQHGGIDTLHSPLTLAEFKNMSDVTSVVYKREFDRKAQPSALESLIESELGIDATVHAYFTPANAQTLEPHTDPYDVVVVQVANQKHWTLCLPQTDNATVSLSEADRAQLQEIKRSHLDGCTTYTMSMLQPMICRNVTLHQGDSMYLPKGVIHYAVTTDTPSAHLTIGLSRTGRTWLDVLTAQCQRTTLPSYVCHQYEALANAVGQTPEGLIWHELAVPGLAAWREQLCASLSPLIMGEESYSLLSALSGIRFEQLQRSLGDRSGLYWPRQKLRQNLGALLQCEPQELAERVNVHHDAAIGLERDRRSSSWTAPCASANTCSASGCDCDSSGCTLGLSCDSGCDSSCDSSCECDGTVACNRGYYRSGAQSEAQCNECAAGKYQPSTGGTSCFSCPQGKYSGKGFNACYTCPSGKYNTQDGSSSCTNAGTGYYVKDSDHTRRLQCAAGKYSDTSTANSCKSCQSSPWPGEYQNQAKQSSCKACPDGKYVTSNSATSCIDQPDLTASYSAAAKSITINVGNSAGRWGQFRISLGLWRSREYAYDDASGYPIEVDASKTSGSYDSVSSHTLSYLIPGQYYYLKIEAMDKDNNEYEDEYAEFNIVQTNCGCQETDTSGPPVNMAVEQYMGKLFFSWEDQSYCEDGFILRRDGTTFTSSYDVASSTACGLLHEPETVFDDIIISPEVDVGQAYSYCVSAYSSTTVIWADDQDLDSRYESSEACADYQVQWEAKVTGQVALGNDEFSKVPVADTNVSWSIGGGTLSGTTTTDANGEFEVYILTDLLTNQFEEMIVSVAKTSEGIEHTYECDGISCTSRTFLVEWLTFENKIEFEDTSSVPLTGYVYADGTITTASPDGCGLQDHRVCFNSRHTHGTIACSYTDVTGYYVVAVPEGLTVYGTVEYEDHEYELMNNSRSLTPEGSEVVVDSMGNTLNYSYFYVDFDVVNGNDINFQDVTKRNVTLQVAGGKCNRTLGTSTIVFTHATCDIELTYEVLYESVQEVPAINWIASYDSTVAFDNTYVTDMMFKYYKAAGVRVQDVDLSSEEATARWEYHPQATIELTISGTKTSSCDTKVIGRDVVSDVTVTVYEEFWDNQADCTWVEGNLYVTNQLGETTVVADELLSEQAIEQEEYDRLVLCNTECEVELQRDDGENADTYEFTRGEMEIQMGEPETTAEVEGVKYAKLFSVRFSHAVNIDSTLAVPVVVTGAKVLSDKFTMEYASFAGAYSHIEGGLSFGTVMESCALVACVETIDYHSHLGVAADINSLEGKIKTSGNKDGSLQVTTTFTLETSDYSGTPSDHLVVVPSLVVKFAEVRVVSFNFTSCESNVDTEIQWTLDKANEIGAFSIKSYKFIEIEELPTLRKNLAYYEAEYEELLETQPDNVASQNETLTKISKINEGIDGWQSILDYIDTMTAQAEAGNLTRQTHLMPSKLMANAMDFDLNKVEDAEANLEVNDAISFSGGGLKYRYESTREQEATSTSGDFYHLDWNARIVGDHDFSATVIGGYVGADVGGEGEINDQDTTTNGSSTTATFGFELSDPDMGDEFLVQVYRDPYFNTMVFATIAGSSSCLHEDNTYALQQPRLLVTRTPAGEVFPDAEAYFTVLLLNDAIGSASYELYIRDETGVSVTADGHRLVQPIVFEQMPGESQYEQVIAVKRYDMSRYTFNVILGYRSRCESIEFVGGDDAALAELQSSEVTLSVEFLQPCSQVDWTGTMSRERSFLVNIEENAEIFRVTLANPETSSRRWEDNGRLEGVHLMYRRVGDVDWAYARNASGDILNFMYGESDYGYSTLEWNTDGVLDGEYELMAVSECTAAGLDPPDGINEVFSSTISGRIDREAPGVFSQPEPVDGVFSAGDVISVKMTEDIVCSRPFPFYVAVTVEGLFELGTNDIDIECSGDTLSLSLYRHFSSATLAGSSVTVVITGVLDLAQNAASEISWTYEYEAPTTTSSVSVAINDLVLTVTWDEAYADINSEEAQALAARIASELASILGVATSRISVQRFSEEADNRTAVSLLFTAAASARRRDNSEQSSEVLVYLLEQALQNGGNFSVVSVDGNTYLETSSIIDDDSDGESSTTATPTGDSDNSASASSADISALKDDVTATFVVSIVTMVLQFVVIVALVWCYKYRGQRAHLEGSSKHQRQFQVFSAGSAKSTRTGKQDSNYSFAQSPAHVNTTYELANRQDVANPTYELAYRNSAHGQRRVTSTDLDAMTDFAQSDVEEEHALPATGRRVSVVSA
ncbi:uncharacterized protein MONBRDRAFT_37822 [Monosiga brevicollis MX1]|uniref:Ribosomal oxygenase 2 n=1 Tax=Monosiga brevicollis TaxID=81824 RepID=A9V428_MONBE|nr:uncharacterized protein MONBRDRAFT_37822 [Monosiga brevicollis MX1]EDQ87632.1 predicted protein [Monosiga brevicollis MX1]|eukprot:XP_001747552.1 hypothetical protein [Monosiga brevicollis MX1]